MSNPYDILSLISLALPLLVPVALILTVLQVLRQTSDFTGTQSTLTYGPEPELYSEPIVSAQCPYCRKEYSSEETLCQYCGAPRTSKVRL